MLELESDISWHVIGYQTEYVVGVCSHVVYVMMAVMWETSKSPICTGMRFRMPQLVSSRTGLHNMYSENHRRYYIK